MRCVRVRRGVGLGAMLRAGDEEDANCEVVLLLLLLHSLRS